MAQVDQLPHIGAAWPVAILPLFGGLAISGMRLALGDKDLEPALKTLNTVRPRHPPAPLHWATPSLSRFSSPSLWRGHALQDPGKSSKDVKIWKFSTKAAAAAVTLGTANSLGPEGPVVELGGNIGLAVGRRLGFRGT